MIEADPRTDLLCRRTVGVLGDRTCPDLRQYVHCRNCPVYAAAATRLLEVDLPREDLVRSTLQIAEKTTRAEHRGRSLFIFRLGVEWYALPTAVLSEIACASPIHSLPHRRSTSVLGVVNIRGVLLACISLAELLGQEPAGRRQSASMRAERFVILEIDGSRFVSPVDEVHGIERIGTLAFRDVAPALENTASAYTTAIVTWERYSVGLLDEQLLFETVDRSLKSVAI